jgi:ATP-dependent helicase HrpA
LLVQLQFPEALPVSARRDEITTAIASHPVIIVSGETGSGKTTQLPKLCIAAGRGVRGLIGHTQPRRLAATSVARRIAEELGSPLGEDVGFKIRFNEKVSRSAKIKLMTDGILLAETQSDPLLRQYDTVIIDEAHERSLNIDFLLGYLKRLLEGPRRNDLKLVITSATIDAARFAAHFGGASGPAPVIEVSGRTFPVEIRWRAPGEGAGLAVPVGSALTTSAPSAPSVTTPSQGMPVAASTVAGTARGPRGRDDDDETDTPAAIESAIDELWREGPGDILVFLPGEREIRETADHLRRAWARRGSRGGLVASAEILSLFSRLSAADQQRVFATGNAPRVVLATNVAETSLTVPGIRYVIDTGVARVKRYRYRGKVEQLQIEAVSRAAANQRAGRCGRVSDGICIRLYDEPDFLKRAAFTDPEILRSSLAAVILRMKSLRLEDIEAFPFVDPPPRRAVLDGLDLLRELDAIDEHGELTATGHQLARLPVDPRIARVLLAAHQGGCLREALIIASALSTQDPRERPLDRQQAADQAHARFVDPRSDFFGYVKLWDWWQAQQQTSRPAGESRRALTLRLDREFLSPRKFREWADVHAQLLEAVSSMKWLPNEQPAAYEPLHRALLAGLLGNLGCRAPDEPYYLGTHATRFWLHPGSGLARRSSAQRSAEETATATARTEASGSSRWVMAAEMVDTGRLYGRTVARLDPVWIEQAAAHLIKRSWSEPHWERRAGQAIAFERATVYGLVIYAQRRTPYGGIDARLSRELLIREALVAGEWDSDCAFFRHNLKVVAEIGQLEARIRRPDLLVDEQFLFDWFDAQLPAEITSGQQLERWWRGASRAQPGLLKLSRELLMRKQTDGIDDRKFPQRLSMRGVSFEAAYHFEPGADDDGVTLTVPLFALNQVDAVRAEWLVPGMLADKVAALLKSLPQKYRRHLLPLDQWAAGFVERAGDAGGARGLMVALIDSLREHASIRVAQTDFRVETVPAHLQMNFRVIDEHGRFLAASRNLAQLRAQLGASAQGSFQAALRNAGVSARAQAMPRDAAASGSTDGRRSPQDSAQGSGSTAIAASETAFGEAAASNPALSETASSGQSRQARDARDATVRRAGERFTAWDFGELPELLELQGMGRSGDATLIGYPALVDRDDAVELQVFDEPESAQREHRRGLRRLFAIALREPLKFFDRNVPEFQRLSMLFMPLGTADELKRDLVDALIDRACLGDPWPTDRTGFEERVLQARPRVTLVGNELARTVAAILTEYASLAKKLAGARTGAPAAFADITQQLAALMPARFVSVTEPARLGHLARYLKAVSARLDKLRAEPARDAQRLAELAPLAQNLARAQAALKGRRDPRLDDFRWMLEELRVSLFAQELRTPMPVSVKRLERVWESIR